LATSRDSSALSSTIRRRISFLPATPVHPAARTAFLLSSTIRVISASKKAGVASPLLRVIKAFVSFV
jgi:hypothetical protein